MLAQPPSAISNDHRIFVLALCTMHCMLRTNVHIAQSAIATVHTELHGNVFFTKAIEFR